MDVGVLVEEWLWKVLSKEAIPYWWRGRTQCGLSTNVDRNAEIHANGTTQGRLEVLSVNIWFAYGAIDRSTLDLGVQGEVKCGRCVNVGKDGSFSDAVQELDSNIETRNQVGFGTAGQSGRSTNLELDRYSECVSERNECNTYIERDVRASFGLTLAELSPSEAGKVNRTSGIEIEAPTEISATIPRSAFAFALMLKEGPTETIPGKSSPGRPTSKSLTSGVWKVPWALASTLKVADTSPERAPVKAYSSTWSGSGILCRDSTY